MVQTALEQYQCTALKPQRSFSALPNLNSNEPSLQNERVEFISILNHIEGNCDQFIRWMAMRMPTDWITVGRHRWLLTTGALKSPSIHSFMAHNRHSTNHVTINQWRTRYSIRASSCHSNDHFPSHHLIQLKSIPSYSIALNRFNDQLIELAPNSNTPPPQLQSQQFNYSD